MPLTYSQERSAWAEETSNLARDKILEAREKGLNPPSFAETLSAIRAANPSLRAVRYSRKAELYEADALEASRQKKVMAESRRDVPQKTSIATINGESFETSDPWRSGMPDQALSKSRAKESTRDWIAQTAKLAGKETLRRRDAGEDVSFHDVLNEIRKKYAGIHVPE